MHQTSLLLLLPTLSLSLSLGLCLDQNTVLDKILLLRAVLDLLIERIGDHVALQLAGLGLQGRRGSGCAQDVPCRSSKGATR